MVLWVPMTSHCAWENFGGLQMFQCAPAAEKSDCSNDGDTCVTVESGGYKVPDATLDVPMPWFAIVLFQLPPPFAALSRQISPPTAAPPEISASWPFAFRTALPSRAPSFVS